MAARVVLSVGPRVDTRLLQTYVRQARTLYNYPGMTSLFLKTKDDRVQAKIDVPCEVAPPAARHHRGRVVSRRLVLVVKRGGTVTRSAYALAEEKRFFKLVEAVCCTEVGVRARVRLASPTLP